MTTLNNTLQPITERGWQSGFKNLLANEYTLWWGGRRWIKSALIWLAVINGFIFLIAFASTHDPSMTPENVVSTAIGVFVNIGVFATSIGIVVGSQGAIIREKQLGTAAWVLSKPASRTAFIFAKWLAYSVSIIDHLLTFPAIVFLIQSQLFWKQIPAPGQFVESWLIMALNLQFYLALTLMLGTIFSARGPVAGIGISFLFAGSLLPLVLPEWITLLFPWMLQKLAETIALGKPLPEGWVIPVIATVVWILIFMGIALWRFGREEF